MILTFIFSFFWWQIIIKLSSKSASETLTNSLELNFSESWVFTFSAESSFYFQVKFKKSSKSSIRLTALTWACCDDVMLRIFKILIEVLESSKSEISKFSSILFQAHFLFNQVNAVLWSVLQNSLNVCNLKWALFVIRIVELLFIMILYSVIIQLIFIMS